MKGQPCRSVLTNASSTFAVGWERWGLGTYAPPPRDGSQLPPTSVFSDKGIVKSRRTHRQILPDCTEHGRDLSSPRNESCDGVVACSEIVLKWPQKKLIAGPIAGRGRSGSSAMGLRSGLGGRLPIIWPRQARGKPDSGVEGRLSGRIRLNLWFGLSTDIGKHLPTSVDFGRP